MDKNIRKIFWPILAVILIIIFTPIFGYLYKSIFGISLSGFFLSINHPEYIPGLIMSYLFFIPFIFSIVIKKNKYIKIILLSIVFILFTLVSGDGNAFIASLLFFILGWLLGEAIPRLYKYFTKN